MFRPPTDAEEELEQAWQLLWQAYGYPRGDIDELQQRLASMDRATMTTTEYAALETRVIRLVRLEKFRRAIEKMRLVRIERDDTQEELRALQRDTAGPTAREMELRLTIDELREEVEELRARVDPAAEPMYKFRKSTAAADLELDALREQVRVQQQEIDRLRLATKPKQSRQELMDKRDALMQEIARMQQQMEIYEIIVEHESVVADALSRMPEKLPNLEELRVFLKSALYVKDTTPNKRRLTDLLVVALDKAAKYWKQRVAESSESNESRPRWQSYADSATFYLENILPNIDGLELKPHETSVAEKAKSIKSSLAAKRGQLTRVLKDLDFYEQNPNINFCLVCGETRQKLLHQERKNPTRVFCGKMCQNKFYN
jgi:hypothetical protein